MDGVEGRGICEAVVGDEDAQGWGHGCRLCENGGGSGRGGGGRGEVWRGFDDGLGSGLLAVKGREGLCERRVSWAAHRARSSGLDKRDGGTTIGTKDR